MLQGRKRSVLCVCCCDCDRGAVLVVCVVVVVLWCARWSSLALIGVQKHRGVLVCRRGHRKHDNDPQSGGTGEGKYRQNKRQRKFLTSAGFPSVWCLSGVPEGLLIAGDHQTSIQTRGKSNSPPSRSRTRQRRKWSCAKHASTNAHTRISKRHSNTRRDLPKSFGSRYIGSGSRHVHLALACASRTGLSKTSPFDQMGRCSGQNGSTRRAN